MVAARGAVRRGPVARLLQARVEHDLDPARLPEVGVGLGQANSYYNGDAGAAFINLGAGGLSVLGYGFVRTALAAPFGTPAGRYQPVLDPWVWIERSVELVSFAVSTVDTLALFGPQRNIGIAVLTLAFGLPLLCLAAWALRGRQPLSLCLLGLACIVATTAPHWPQSHVSELYAYPTVATAVLLLACGLAAKPVGGWQWKAALLLYAATAVAVDLHKVGAMLKTGDAARHVGQQVHALIPEPPASLCVTSTPPCGSGYSVFFGEPGPASGWGRAAQAEWGWQRSVHVTSVVDASTCRANSVIVEMTCDGTVSFHSVQLDP